MKEKSGQIIQKDMSDTTNITKKGFHALPKFLSWDRPGILLESRWWSLKGRNSAVRLCDLFI